MYSVECIYVFFRHIFLVYFWVCTPHRQLRDLWMFIKPWVPYDSNWPAEVALLLVEGKGSEKKEQSDSKGPEPTVPGPKIHEMSRNSVVCALGFPHFWMSVEDMPQIHRCFSFGCSSGSWQNPDWWAVRWGCSWWQATWCLPHLGWDMLRLHTGQTASKHCKNLRLARCDSSLMHRVWCTNDVKMTLLPRGIPDHLVVRDQEFAPSGVQRVFRLRFGGGTAGGPKVWHWWKFLGLLWI